MPRCRLGAHVSIAGGLHLALARGAELGCEAVQIFVKSPSQWRAKELTEEAVEAFRSAAAASEIRPLVAHAAYLINLAAADAEVLERSREALVDELGRCHRLGIDYLVLHPGAHMGRGVAAGVERAGASLRHVFDRLEQCTTRLLLENTAGQGTVLGARLEELEALLVAAGAEPSAEPSADPNADPGARSGGESAAKSGAESGTGHDSGVGLCIDTCHAFAAGYDIGAAPTYQAFWREFDERFGRSALGCLHLNDSRFPLASRRDRHATLGQGEIGPDLFERLARDPRLAGRGLIIETPRGDDAALHRADLELLRHSRDGGSKRRSVS